jgi:hypothetical protein
MRARDANADKVIAATRVAFQEAANNYNGLPATWWRLHNAALAYVSALTTDGADGHIFNKSDRPKWLEFMRSNSHAIAGALLELNEPAVPAPRKIRRSRKAA